ncbi:hypothetical protein AKJ37_02160 [candidate division MSBL1 archaeon SCGC-AAA259I09]|uniref:Uncharacterized protein n=2 Tax=candidate division MSBL1 TaxID=215777 RepID=A0A133UUN6_9EURY|nr:hypothetical protein AKJ62_02010 [candidate division MSBL1 archaeon SCGC-AAA259D14]KXA97850.1 hypothetical protein AKJ37_02160 [candidate division MSBL1 archaeon SCGC-AAA259I09]
MDLRDLAGILVLVIVLQLVLGGILYGFIGVKHFSLQSVSLSVLLMVTASASVATLLYWIVNRYARERAVRTAMMAMSEDEEKVLRKVISQREARQDELWRKLDMSRGKTGESAQNRPRSGWRVNERRDITT